jgi:hypothetical protein
MRTLRLVDATLVCYPAWWRETYGEEIRKLTEDLVVGGRSEWRLSANLMRGAFATRLRANAMPMRRELWAARTRASIAVATLPWLVALPFVLAAITDRDGYQSISSATISHLAVSPGTRVTTDAYQFLQTALLVTFLAAAVGWSTLARGVRQSPRPHRRRLIALSYLPLIAFVADLGLFIARQTQTSHSFFIHGGPPVPLGGHPVAAHALLIALWAVFLVGVLASVFSVVIVTKHVNLPMLSLRSGKRIAAFTACSLTLMASLAIAGAIAGSYGSRLVPSLGNFLYGGHYSAGTYLVVLPEWWLAAVPLALAAVISLSGWRSARRAWRTTLWLTESV